jgi:integrase
MQPCRPTTSSYRRLKADGKNVTYYLRFTDQHGKRQEFPVGSTPDWNLGRAQDALDHIKADVERGIWKPKVRAPTPAVNPETLRFEDMAYDWYENKVSGQLARRTQKAYKPELELHLVPFFGKMAVKNITRRDVDAFSKQQLTKGLSPSYINSQLQRLGQVLELAMDGYRDPPILLENPARAPGRRVENPASADADRWLEPDHVELLLHAARLLDSGQPQTRIHPKTGTVYTIPPRAAYCRLGRESIIAGLCFTGLRNTELCELFWARIDFARRLVRSGGTKTRAASRDINITDGLVPYLIGHRNQTPFAGQSHPVWANANGGFRNKDNLNRRIIQPVVQKARELIAEDEANSERTGEPRRIDIVLPDDITAHTFRRTFCGFCTEIERDPDYVRGQMGHTDPKFTQRVYNRIKDWSGEPDPRVVAWMQRPTREAPASRLRLAQ